MYMATTRNIRIEVEPSFLDEQSEPDEDHFMWAYRVRIENQGDDRVQLRARHWRITDARGQTTEVKGMGVVGEQPILDPGEAYEYTSGTPLKTPSGIMGGAYQMELGSGETFLVEVPTFSLDSPHERSPIN